MDNFSLFFENHDPVLFLTSALEKFPDSADVMVLADAMEEDGESVLANLIRNLVQNRASRDKDWIIPYLQQAREELYKIGIMLHARSGLYGSVQCRGEGLFPSRQLYEWRGKIVVLKTTLSSGSDRKEVIKIEDIKDNNIIKGLAVLAAIFYAKSHSSSSGLEEYTTSKRTLNREGKRQSLLEPEFRNAIGSFLLYFGILENLVQKINNTTRPRYNDMRNVTNMLNYRREGYLWEIPITREILQRFIKDNARTPFMERLGIRIFRTLNLVSSLALSPRMQEIQIDQNMYSDLEGIANLLRGRS